jgi:hypothetical protein
LESQLFRSITGQNEILLGIVLMIITKFPNALNLVCLVSQLVALWQETDFEKNQ